MGVNRLVPLESDSRMKAGSYCLLQMFALSRVSVFKIPFSLSEVIPNASFLKDLTNDQNFFTFSFFSGAVGIRVIHFKREYIGNMLPVCVSYGLSNMCSEVLNRL